MASLSEMLKNSRFSGSSSYKHADFPHRDHTIDLSAPRKNNVYTSIDCYITGSYIAKNRVFNITQRYTVFVSYNSETQREAMMRTRDRIIQDFQANFPEMNINEVFIPEGKFIIPTGGPGGTQPVEFYQGSNLWKRMAKVDVGRYKIGVEKEIYNSRVGKIKNKYGL